MHAYNLIFWFLGAMAFTLLRLIYDEWQQHIHFGSSKKDSEAGPQPTTAQLSG